MRLGPRANLLRRAISALPTELSALSREFGVDVFCSPGGEQSTSPLSPGSGGLSAGDHEALGDGLALGLVLAFGLAAAFGSDVCPWAANAFAAFFLSLEALRLSAFVLG